jgi:hypothetical protein
MREICVAARLSSCGRRTEIEKIATFKLIFAKMSSYVGPPQVFYDNNDQQHPNRFSLYPGTSQQTPTSTPQPLPFPDCLPAINVPTHIKNAAPSCVFFRHDQPPCPLVAVLPTNPPAALKGYIPF